MNIQKEINAKLDEILKFREEIKRMEDEVDANEEITNLETGEKTNKEGALRVVEGMIDQIKEEINLLTNNGENVKDIFTNNYYINDTMQDREIVEGEINKPKNNDNNNVDLRINADEIPPINIKNIKDNYNATQWDYYKNKTSKNNPELNEDQINDIVEGLKKAYWKWQQDNNK
tara:strand:- start:877 stop:1398 length:522 start_codon:yes stop_codon:yes gene_type:complete